MHTSPLDVLTVLVICSIVSGVSISFRVLDIWGAILAFIMGLVIGLFGHPLWLVMLLVFLVSSFAATKYEYRFKLKRRVAEGRGGKRGFDNVLANGWLPMVIAFLSAPIPDIIPSINRTVATVMFLTAICTAASDTLASEFGVLSPRVYMITQPSRRVEPGIDGGVSAFGTAASLFAALFAGVVGWSLLMMCGCGLPGNGALIFLPIILGFTGCQVDSVLGAVFETRGMLSGSRVNLISIFVASMIAYMLMYMLPGIGIPW